jgi:hypothetical protein
LSYWIFKLAEQELYPDVPGKEYVFDNTHSIRVREGDAFLYLDKRKGYSFTASGVVARLDKREPTAVEAGRNNKIRTVFVASLQDVVVFKRPLSITPTTKAGRRNRALLGIEDANLLGWSQSMPGLGETMYDKIMDLAEDRALIPLEHIPNSFAVPDTWARVKIRRVLKGFTDDVLTRSGGACVVCGTAVPGLVDAAHLSGYATDRNNRANPSNGMALCAFCHRAFDQRLIAVKRNGELLVSPKLTDAVATFHVSRIDGARRALWLEGVGEEFIELTVRLFGEANTNGGDDGET